jgi:hypothetical protein
MRNRKLKAPPQKQKKEKKAPKGDQDKSKKTEQNTQRQEEHLHTEKKTMHSWDKQWKSKQKMSNSSPNRLRKKNVEGGIGKLKLLVIKELKNPPTSEQPATI